MTEADLYPPIKAFLEQRGFQVKGEIGACDVFAVRAGNDAPLVVELKDRLSLALVLQAVDRLAITDQVYLAFRIGRSHSATWRRQRRQIIGLLRRLGLGLLTVSAGDRVRAVLDPAPYTPRGNARRRHRLLREFTTRVGDPEPGGSPAQRRMTAYRQDALRCALALDGASDLKVADVRQRSGVQRAGTVLQANHYAWFERVRFGHYRLAQAGSDALRAHQDLLPEFATEDAGAPG